MTPSKIMSEAGRRVNVTRPLTRSLDLTEEGLAMQATHAGDYHCECGCGASLRPGRRFAQGHNRRKPLADFCVVAGCEKPPSKYGRPMCTMHRARVVRTGTTELIKPTAADDSRRFWQHVDTTAGPTECWPWDGTLVRGYGQFQAQGEKVAAHRFAYEDAVGPIPAGLHVDHVWTRGCRRTDCVNPAHLEPVTPAENSRRRDEAFRARKAGAL